MFFQPIIFCFSVCEHDFTQLITLCRSFQKQSVVRIRHFSSFLEAHAAHICILLRSHTRFHPLLIIYLE